MLSNAIVPRNFAMIRIVAAIAAQNSRGHLFRTLLDVAGQQSRKLPAAQRLLAQTDARATTGGRAGGFS
jgi:hypothetical protein